MHTFHKHIHTSKYPHTTHIQTYTHTGTRTPVVVPAPCTAPRAEMGVLRLQDTAIRRWPKSHTEAGKVSGRLFGEGNI